MRLRIEKAVYGGDGLARLPAEEPLISPGSPAGKAVFVPYVLSGEVVEAQITGGKRGYANAKLLNVIEPSPDRIVPSCEYFGACGGCQYQHAAVETQLQIKLGVLRETLERASLARQPGTTEIHTVSSPPWAYRNRARMRIQKDPKAPGGVALCYRERASHRNLSVTHCPIAAPLIEKAIKAVLLRGVGAELVGFAEEIEFFTNDRQDALMAVLTSAQTGRSRSSNQAFQRFCDALRANLPQLSGAGLFNGDERRLMGQWGETSLTYSVSQQEYEVGLGSFFQVNRYLLSDLVEIVTSGRSGALAWDLFAGVGLFSRVLNFEQVVAVEASRSAAADLQRNLPSHHRAVSSTTLKFLQNQSRRLPSTPDLVVADPPRAGLGPEVCALLARIAPRALVYVSCDPATLARDLQVLLHSGLHVKKMTLVDLFPQTFHIETVTELEQG